MRWAADVYMRTRGSSRDCAAKCQKRNPVRPQETYQCLALWPIRV